MERNVQVQKTVYWLLCALITYTLVTTTINMLMLGHTFQTFFWTSNHLVVISYWFFRCFNLHAAIVLVVVIMMLLLFSLVNHMKKKNSWILIISIYFLDLLPAFYLLISYRDLLYALSIIIDVIVIILSIVYVRHNVLTVRRGSTGDGLREPF